EFVTDGVTRGGSLSVATESAEGISFRGAGSATLSRTVPVCAGKTRLANRDEASAPIEACWSWLGPVQGNSPGTTLIFRNGVTECAEGGGLLLGLGAGLGGSVGGTGAAGCCCCCSCCWFSQSRFIFSKSRCRSNLILSSSSRNNESLLLNSSVTAVP